MQRPAPHIDREVQHRNEVLQQITGKSAQEPPAQNDQRQFVLVQVQQVVQLFNRKRRVGIEFAVSLLPRGARSAYQGAGIIEFGHDAVDAFGHPFTSSPTLACGSSVRTSKIEIMGSSRINRKNRNRNNPIVPQYVAQSQRVAWNSDQDEGT